MVAKMSSPGEGMSKMSVNARKSSPMERYQNEFTWRNTRV